MSGKWRKTDANVVDIHGCEEVCGYTREDRFPDVEVIQYDDPNYVSMQGS
jgi:hypothetical protein